MTGPFSPWPWSAVDVLLLAAGLGWLFLRLRTVRLLRAVPPLERVQADPPADAVLPSVTVVAAGRDEGPHLEAAVRSWLAQRVPDLGVVFVDDRSSDSTPAVAQRLAAEDRRLRVVRVAARPAGWLGKCHALHQGARQATTDFVLFTDADVKLHPDCLRRALAYCERERVDHLALLPHVETDGLVQEAFTACFFQAFLASLVGPRPNTDDRRCALGVGAFGLVRRSALESVGGFEEIRLQVGDDPALARLLVNAGFRHRVLDGREWLWLHWQRGLVGTVRGLEKNTFWALRFSVPLLLLFTLAGLASIAPLLAPLRGTLPAWLGFGAWGLGVLVPYLAAPTSLRRRLVAAALHPFSALVLVLTAWNSAVRTLLRGGISWRGDFFPVGELRAALKPLPWWRP